MNYLAGIGAAYAANVGKKQVYSLFQGMQSAFKRRATAMAVNRLRRLAPTRIAMAGARARLNRAVGGGIGRRRGGYRPNTLYARNLRHAGLLGIEHKYYDTYLVAKSLVAPTDEAGGECNPSTTSMISTPAQGDAHNNRDGREIVITALEVEGHIAFQALAAQTATTVPAIVFIAIVVDTQTNGAELNSEDVYINPSATAVMNCEPLRNILFGGRFRVLKTFRLIQKIDYVNDGNPAANPQTFAAAGDRMYFQYYRKNMKLKVRFNAGTTANVGNVMDNSIQLIAWANDIAYTPKISYNARIRFVG